MRWLPCNSCCLVPSNVQVKNEAHAGNYEKNIEEPNDAFGLPETAHGWKKSARPKRHEVLTARFLYPLICQGIINLYPRTAKLNVECRLESGAGFPSHTQIHFDHCVFKQYQNRSVRFQV